MSTKTKTIINRRKHNLRTETGIMLRPGENVMGEEKARKLGESAAAKQWHSLGWIGVKPVAKAVALEEELSDGEGDKPMSAKDAIDFVGAETDASVLEGMLEDEERKTVIAAIESRLHELNVSPDDASDGDEG